MTVATRSAQLIILIALSAASGLADETRLANGDFELPAAVPGLPTPPDKWTIFSSTTNNKITLVDKQGRTGKQSCRFTAQEVAGSYQGLYQAVPVSAGKRCEFQLHARNDTGNPLKAPARGQISIEWKDATGNEVDRTWGPDWGADLPADGWKKIEVAGTAPPTAVAAHVVITQHDGAESGANGAFYVDDAVTKVGP